MSSNCFDKMFVRQFKQLSRKFYYIGHNQVDVELMDSSTQWKHSLHCPRQPSCVHTNMK